LRERQPLAARRGHEVLDRDLQVAASDASAR
jgi:hypothetical protein